MAHTTPQTPDTRRLRATASACSVQITSMRPYHVRQREPLLSRHRWLILALCQFLAASSDLTEP